MTTSWFDHIFNHSHQINELIGTLLFNNDIADNFDIDFDKCTLNCQFHTEMSWKYGKNLISLYYRCNISSSFLREYHKAIWNGILLPKLIWRTLGKNCSNDRESVRLKAKNLQEFWDQANNLLKQWKVRTIFNFKMRYGTSHYFNFSIHKKALKSQYC